MSHWIELTGKDGETKVYVNMAVATQVIPKGKGSHICFPGDDDSYLAVEEKPAEVISKLDEANADRT